MPLDKERLTEPYVSARDKGTGLGLAIVRKIMEDHKGLFLLEDRVGGGAKISMIFDTKIANNSKLDGRRTIRSQRRVGKF